MCLCFFYTACNLHAASILSLVFTLTSLSASISHTPPTLQSVNRTPSLAPITLGTALHQPWPEPLQRPLYRALATTQDTHLKRNIVTGNLLAFIAASRGRQVPTATYNGFVHSMYRIAKGAFHNVTPSLRQTAQAVRSAGDPRVHAQTYLDRA